ncbi:unnamed protein product, partial [Allacma fusca]
MQQIRTSFAISYIWHILKRPIAMFFARSILPGHFYISWSESIWLMKQALGFIIGHMLSQDYIPSVRTQLMFL